MMAENPSEIRDIRIRLGNGFGFGFFAGLGFAASQLFIGAGVTLLCVALTLSGWVPSLFQAGPGAGLEGPTFVPSAMPPADPCSPPGWSTPTTAPPTLMPTPPPYSTEGRAVPTSPDTVAPESLPSPGPYSPDSAPSNRTDSE